MLDLKEKRVTVMGIGLHGGSLEMIKWLCEQGARVVATDIKKKEDLEPTIKKLEHFKNLKIITGQHRPEDFSNADLVIKNPTVPWKNKYIQKAIKNNIPIEMDSSLFMQACKSSKIIGVTGTKGKTTTASLIAEIFQKAGLKISKVGIGREPVMNKLKEIEKDTYVVFELSSWRLAGLKKIKKSPHCAVLTNIYPDHLNHYDSMDKYIDDKRQIYINQTEKDFSIFNIDNDYCKQMLQESKSQVFSYSLYDIEKDKSVFIRNRKILSRIDGEEDEIMDIKEVGLRGSHNIYNALAAIETCLIFGLDKTVIKKTVKNFKSVDHRLECVRELKGVKYYNDTTATTPEAAIAGVNSFLKPISLIAGGSSKKLESLKLAKKIAKSKYIKRVFLMQGSATEDFKKEIINEGGEEKIVSVYDDFEKLIEEAASKSKEGEIVLLSPGFASFGMFKNEFDRGRRFKEIVKNLT